MIWFEEHPELKDERYRKECRWCGSKEVFTDGAFINDIHKEVHIGYLCKNCRERWCIEEK